MFRTAALTLLVLTAVATAAQDPLQTQGDTLRMDAQSHIGENIGTTDTHVLLVEVVGPHAAAAKP